MKLDLPKFEGSLNPDVYIKCIQSLKRSFKIKEHSDEKAFKMVVVNSRSMPMFGMKILKGNERRREDHGLELGPNSRNSDTVLTRQLQV